MNLGDVDGGPAPAAPPLRFSLTILDGRARLAGSPGPVPVLGRVDRLALEVPGLRFPFDLSQGARAFQSRRCRLVEFGFSLAPLELEHALARAPLGRFGLANPMVALVPGGLRVGLRAKVAGREAELSAKVVVGTEPGGQWRITLVDARVHGFVPVPAPLLLAGVPAALGLLAGGTGAGGDLGHAHHWATIAPSLVHARGLTEFDLDIAAVVLVALLSAAGWRLPSREGLVSLPLGLGDGRVAFALGVDPDPVTRDPAGAGANGSAAQASSERGLASLAEAALFAGEVRAATEGFRQALAAEPDNDFARERLFQLLGASSDGLPELETLADDCLLARPNFLLGLVAKAVAAAEDGRAPEAAWLYSRIAAEAEAAGEVIDEVAARVAAAEQFIRAGEESSAVVALEKALAVRPDHAGARRAVAARAEGTR
jgi:hypothetical protein